MPRGTMGSPVAVAVADRRFRMDAHARSTATDERLRIQFMAALSGYAA